jgi:class 3 adenylate cyclase
VARRFAELHPERVDRLVLFNPFSPIRSEDREWLMEIRRIAVSIVDGAAQATAANPIRGRDPAFVEWQNRAGRLGASPSQAARIWEAEFKGGEATAQPASCDAPTLVIVRRSPEQPIPAEFLARAAHELPNASLVELPDGDSFPIGEGVDAVLAEISRFLVGEVRLPRPDREIRAIMFTDLVDSTVRAASDGDARWRALLDRHDFVCEQVASRCGGVVVKTTGDGVLALFASVTAAIDAARDIGRRLAADGLAIRTGIHVGEIDHRGDDVSGMAVNIAARIMSEAAPGQIALTGVAAKVGGVDDSVPMRTTKLKGSDATWDVYSV